MSRAPLFMVAGVLAVALSVPVSMWIARPPSDLTPHERLGGEIGCSCGTCPMRPIATCGCGFADGMLARLDQELAAGRSDAEIMATFVAEYGPAIRIKPSSSGFDLMAWVAPMVLLMAGAVAMAAVISRWREQDSTTPSTAPDAHSDGSGSDGSGQAPEAAREAAASDEGSGDPYRAIVERELDLLDD